MRHLLPWKSYGRVLYRVKNTKKYIYVYSSPFSNLTVKVEYLLSGVSS